MNRWIHAGFGLLVLGLVAGLVVAMAAGWPRPALPPTSDPGLGSGSLPLTPGTGRGGGDSDGTENRSGTRRPRPQGGTTVVPCPEPGPPGRLSVLTFNIHGGLSHTGYRLDRIAEEIRAWDADVVLLQEVDRGRARTGYADQPSWLASRLSMNVVFGRNVVWAPPASGRREQEYGTAILSRLPIQNWSNVALPRQPGQEPRGLLRARVAVGGQWVDIYNTHLQHTRGNIRIVQLQAIREILAANPFPHIVGGDLNATPDSPALGVVRGRLADPWPVVGEGAGLTVPPRAPRRRIDYLLHDPAWVPISARTFVSSVSDHRAVRVELELPLPASCR